MEDSIQDLMRQKIQEVLRACGIDKYGTEIVTHEIYRNVSVAIHLRENDIGRVMEKTVVSSYKHHCH